MTLNIQSIFGENNDVLKERWQQSGSTIISITGDETDDSASVFTCSTGKDAYIKSITVSLDADHTSPGYFKLTDGGVGGTVIFYIGLADSDLSVLGLAGNTFTFNFDIPLKFGTDIYITYQGTTAYQWLIQGWEESE